MSIAKQLINCFERGNKVLICGNGGSAAQAQHFSGELVCKFQKDRRPLPAICLSTDTSVLTAIANDYSYGHVFSRQIEALGEPNDVLITMTTSGKSLNVLMAEVRADELSLEVFRLPNKGKDTPTIQENHLKLIHSICREVEDHFTNTN